MIESIRPYLEFAPDRLFAILCGVFLLTIPLLWWRTRSSRRQPAVRYSGTGRLGALPRSLATRLRSLPTVLRTLAILAFVYALARPQLGGESVDRREGIAIEMVLDVSGSMREMDFVIDGRRARRIDAVKKVFRDFVLGKEGLPGRLNDMIGMTAFAMYADVKSPLTLDHANLVNLLDETDIPGWVRGVQRDDHPEAAFTSLGDAIVQGTDELRRAAEQAQAGVAGAEAARSLVMILLTDGQDNPPPEARGQAPGPIEAAELARSLNVRIYTIGAVGSGGNRGMGIFAQRRSEVDEPTLKEIARKTDGRYFRATDTESLRTIYEEIDHLERRSTGERTYRDNIAAARVAMLIGLSLIMAELLLANTRLRRLP